ncbi:MAG: hypothetical protein CM15mV13_0260 [uncultured marine virus]|nr:MAG: hypothetical protein CM15mV13_0260 [uncultured marine virus]
MATSQVNGWADEFLSGLTTNAKAYRLANITKRQSEMKQSSDIADDRIQEKRRKLKQTILASLGLLVKSRYSKY